MPVCSIGAARAFGTAHRPRSDRTLDDRRCSSFSNAAFVADLRRPPSFQGSPVRSAYFGGVPETSWLVFVAATVSSVVEPPDRRRPDPAPRIVEPAAFSAAETETGYRMH